MAHLVAGQILEYDEATGKLVPVANLSTGAISGKPLPPMIGAEAASVRRRKRRRRPVAKRPAHLTPAQARAARLLRRKKLAELRAARIAAAKRRKEEARKRHLAALAKRGRRLTPKQVAEMRRHPETRRGPGHFGTTRPRTPYQTNLTLRNLASAKRILKPTGMRRLFILWRSAKAGNKQSVATIQRLNVIASQPPTPANTGQVAAARASLTALAAWTTGMFTDAKGTIPPVSRIDMTQDEGKPPTQSERIERGAEPAFVPSSDAAPTSSEYEQMAPTRDMETEEQAESQNEAEAAEELQDVDAASEEAADEAESTADEAETEEAEAESPEGPEPEGEEASEEAEPSEESASSDDGDQPPMMGWPLADIAGLDDYANIGGALMIAEGNPEIGFSLRKIGRGIKKGVRATGRGIAKGGKAVGKGAFKGAKGIVKAHIYVTKLTLKGFKAVGAGVARLAAAPIRMRVKTLANRRTKYLAWHNRGSRSPNASEAKQGAAYALARTKAMGPLGKLAVFVLHHTRRGSALIGWPLADIAGVPRSKRHEMTNEEAWGKQTRSSEEIARDYAERPMKKAYRNRKRYDDMSMGELLAMTPPESEMSVMGMTGAEIAGIATAVVTALSVVLAKSNKPGEAPANPYAEKPAGGEEDAPQSEPEGDSGPPVDQPSIMDEQAEQPEP